MVDGAADDGAGPAREQAWVVRALEPGANGLAQVRGMMRLFGEAFEDPDRYTGEPPGDAYLQALLANPAFIAIAAVAGQQVVGGLTAHVLPKVERATAELYLYDLAVHAGWRRQGVARALIQALQQRAGALGAQVVFVQADVGDDEAIALYSRLGQREEVLHFDLPPLAPPLAAPLAGRGAP